MLIPASLALVIQAFPVERRVHAVGLWGATAAAAAGLGPPIGGALVKWGDWRWAFLVNLPVGWLRWWQRAGWLVESRSPGRRTLPDLRGAVLLALAMGLLTTAIVTGNDWGWTQRPGAAVRRRRGGGGGGLRPELAGAPQPAGRPGVVVLPGVRRRQRGLGGCGAWASTPTC